MGGYGGMSPHLLGIPQDLNRFSDLLDGQLYSSDAEGHERRRSLQKFEFLDRFFLPSKPEERERVDAYTELLG